MKYVFTQHTPMHLQLPKVVDGKVVMTTPDAAAVAKAVKANMDNGNRVRAAFKNKAEAAKVKITPVAIVPKAEPVVDTDIIMTYGNTYELPSTEERIKELVALGYLVSTEPVAGGRAATTSEGEE